MPKLEEFIRDIVAYNPTANIELLREAYRFAQYQHAGQRRKSNDPYFVHCEETVRTLIDLHMDIETICAGIMHDVLEDTKCSPEDMEAKFGRSITNLVLGVSKINTKINELPFRGATQAPQHMQDENARRRALRQAEHYRNMMLAMAGDVRVILIKLADRLHNMRTLEYLKPARQQEIARETLAIFAPLGHRLGIAKIKSELEDLAFKFLEPEKYREIQRLVNERREEREEYTRNMAALISEVLASESIEAEVFGRPKHFYSIHQKMEQKGTAFEDIYDLIAFRVLVATEDECYPALGVIHGTWVPIPGRFRDFINLPKINGYQSLHTTVQIKKRRIEIQIRTREMHQRAEYGIAAHWRYKEGIPRAVTSDEQFQWIRQMVENLQEVQDPHQLVECIEADLFPDEVYVFTPQGDLLALGGEATPLDFAYAIHTDLGHRCVGARVNGTFVPLRHTLQTGDQVEILTDSNAKPGRDWLRIAKTSRARSKIRRWLNDQERAQNHEIGGRLLEHEMLKRRLNPRQHMKSEELQHTWERLGFDDLDGLLVSIGQGKTSVQHVLNLMFPREEEVKKEETREVEVVPQRHAISIGGINDAVLRIANCCKPLPGESVIGFITRGRGISVHHMNCARVGNEPERLIHVDWPVTETTYPTQITVYADDRKQLLGDIATAIGKSEVNILKGEGGSVDPFTACHRFTVEVTGIEQLRRVIGAISRVRGVQRVERRLPKGAKR